MKKKNKVKQRKLKIIFKQAEGVSEEEIQQRLNSAFDILLSGVVEREK